MEIKNIKELAAFVKKHSIYLEGKIQINRKKEVIKFNMKEYGDEHFVLAKIDVETQIISDLNEDFPIHSQYTVEEYEKLLKGYIATIKT